MYISAKFTKYETCAFFHRFHILYISQVWSSKENLRSPFFEYVDSLFLKVLVQNMWISFHNRSERQI